MLKKLKASFANVYKGGHFTYKAHILYAWNDLAYLKLVFLNLPNLSNSVHAKLARSAKLVKLDKLPN